MLAPYGVAVRKHWLFAQGGRPVIYGPGREREDLPESMRWRHVTFTPEYDFMWLREWRIQTEGLELDPNETLVVVPNADAGWGLTHESGAEQEYDGPGEYITEYWTWRDWFSFELDQLDRDAAGSDKVVANSLEQQALRCRDEEH
jgi:hypothetical protein